LARRLWSGTQVSYLVWMKYPNSEGAGITNDSNVCHDLLLGRQVFLDVLRTVHLYRLMLHWVLWWTWWGILSLLVNISHNPSITDKKTKALKFAQGLGRPKLGSNHLILFKALLLPYLSSFTPINHHWLGLNNGKYRAECGNARL
jgi:hypothetical protein